MSFLIAQAGESYLGWTIQALGPLCLLILVLSGVASFIMTVAIVRKGKGPLAGSALMLAVLLPFYLGALVGTVTLVVMGLGRLTSRGVECTC